MAVRRLPRLIASLACITLAGCGRVASLTQPPLDAIHRGLALDAVNRLSEALNRGACSAIYYDASKVFRELETETGWKADCARMRAGLGSLHSFSLRAAFSTGPATVLVDGTALFAKGPCHLGITWVLEDGHARLFSFYLQGPAGPMAFPPPWPHLERRHADPPPPASAPPAETA